MNNNYSYIFFLFIIFFGNYTCLIKGFNNYNFGSIKNSVKIKYEFEQGQMNIGPGAIETLKSILQNNKHIFSIYTTDTETIISLKEDNVSKSFYRITRLGDSKNGSIEIGKIPDGNPPTGTTKHFLDEINYIDQTPNLQHNKRDFFISLKDKSAANSEKFMKENKSETHICRVSCMQNRVVFSRLDKEKLKDNLQEKLNNSADKTYTILKKLNLSEDDLYEIYKDKTHKIVSISTSDYSKINEALLDTPFIQDSSATINPGLGKIDYIQVFLTPQSITVLIMGENGHISAVCQTIIQKMKYIKGEENLNASHYIKPEEC